ncbi:DUF4956 domain-containing protein [Flavimobilis marinus]|uniref:DUF4956 domain-containing protein n=1 Tax=Flavimobilis marinus TaxID=285351 RepID=A0A1I2DK61_9MICO|nr:DUF4956 domain-containing protein [Flavimobilis marinus]GHG45111.1 DUF4956 domain-containing protein [Flavimobilis marinus]SFE80290.1 protein of unknown function [Flavimobilis marinus]
MTPSTLLAYGLDLVAVSILTFGLYFPRHRRRELVVAYLGVNVGVLAVCAALAESAIGAGLGLGLFGVLSIIRLRSTELGQHEVAYYFSALALGLLCGLPGLPLWSAAALCALVLLVVHVGDHPRLLARYRAQVVVVDRAYLDHGALVAHLEQLLGGTVHQATVQKVDLVQDTTLVDVRFSSARATAAVAR